MSTLLSALVSRQLLLRLTSSKCFNICHNQNYNCVSIQRFCSAFHYNDGRRRRRGRASQNYDEPEQQQQQFRYEDNDINRRNNSRRPPSNYSRDERGRASNNFDEPEQQQQQFRYKDNDINRRNNSRRPPSSYSKGEQGRASNNFDEPEQQQQFRYKDNDINRRNNNRGPPSSYSRDEQESSLSSFNISGQPLVFKNIEQILSHLEVADEGLIDSFALKDLIQKFRRCLVGHKTHLTNEEILESAGLKKLLYLLTKRQLSVSTLLDVFGIFVKLQVPGDYLTFQEICTNLSTHVVKLELNRINFLSHQIRNLSPSAKSSAGVQQLEQVMGQLLPTESMKELLEFIAGVDEYDFSVTALEDVVEKFRRLLTTDGPIPKQEEEAILNSTGMKKLCRLILRESPSPEIDVNFLINALGIFQLLSTPASHRTFKSVLSLIRQRLDENSMSQNQAKYLSFVLEKLRPESISKESVEISEILQNFTSYRNSFEFLDSLERLPEKKLEDKALHDAIKLLRQLLMKEQLSPSKSAKILSSAGMIKLRRSMDAEAIKKKELININSVLNLFGIFELLATPASHPTFQNVVLFLQNQLDNGLLDMDQLHFLNYQLEKLRSISKSKKSAELQSSVRNILFNKQIQSDQTEGNENDHQKIDLPGWSQQLELAVKSESVSLLRNVLGTISAEQGNLRYQDCFYIWWNIADFVSSEVVLEDYIPLLDTIFQILIQNVGLMQAKEIEIILEKCAKSFKLGNTVFYNANFVQALLTRSLEIGDNDSLLHIVPSVRKLQHRDTQLMEVVTDIVIKRASLGAQLDDEIASNIHTLLTKFNYTSRQWEIVKDILLDHPVMMKNLKQLCVSHVLGFLCMDLLPVNLLHKIFSPDFETELNDWVHAEGHGPLPLLTILAALKYFYPNYQGPLPSMDTVREWENMAVGLTRRQAHILPYLEDAFGGQGSVLTSCIHGGVFIDHCVALRPNGSSLYLGDGTKGCSLPDINPEDAKLILIDVLRKKAFVSNERVLKTIHILRYKMMKKLGHPIVRIDLHHFRELPEADRISWLKDQVLNQHQM